MKGTRWMFVIFAALLVLLCASYGYSHYFRSAQTKGNMPKSDFLKKVQATSFERQADVVDEFWDKMSPPQMLAEMETLRDCHELAHAVGQRIMRDTKDFAKSANVCRMHCTGGCFHGILFEIFK